MIRATSVVPTTATARKNWWHDHPLFQLVQGKATARPGKEREFEFGWKPVNRFAYAYELLRRLPKLVEMVKRSKVLTKLVPPPREDLALLKGAKPYDQLGFREREILRMILLCGRWPRPLTTTSGDEARLLGHYSEPLPPWHVDLFASDNAIANQVLEWISHQRERVGIPTSPKQVDDGPSRNAGQVNEAVRWDHLDYIDNPRLLTSKAKSAHNKRRNRLYEYAMRDAKKVVAAVAWMARDRDVPYLPPEWPNNSTNIW